MNATRPDEGAVLAAINDLRVELELPPLDAIPHGRPKAALCCPIAKALSLPDHPACVGGGWAITDVTAQCLPTLLKDFIGAFDHGGYPELIAAASPDSEDDV